jgi:xylan 1,4-beta-xylosidase
MPRTYLALLLAAAGMCQTGGHNPVLPGDHPDPSVIRIGGDYWATATTSQWAPVFPILHSTDLVSWKTVGAVFPKPPEWSHTNYWAPEIAEYKGRIFVYYTAKKKDGPLCVAVATADTPRGPYTDHGPMVCQEAGSIDAVPATDENGERYLIWKEDGNSRRQPTPLWAQKLSEDGLRLVGERRELFRNDAPWERQLVEGSFVVRRDGWFYMFYSAAGCCGLKCDYVTGVARARKLLGPWEKYAGNPILAGNGDWKCPGHGSVVEDARGRMFFLYHAYHPVDFIWLGRQGMLDEIVWGPDGWPAINRGKGPSATSRRVPKGFADEFQAVSPELQWPVSHRPDVRAEGGWLALTARGGIDLLQAVIAKPPTATDYAATTRIDLSKLRAGDRVGLAAYGNAQNAIGVAAGREGLTLWRREKGRHVDLASAAFAGKFVHLRMTSTGGKRFDFAWSPDGRVWREFQGPQDGGALPPWDLATRIALTSGGADGAAGRFDYLRIQNR